MPQSKPKPVKTARVSDQTDAMGIYLEGLFNRADPVPTSDNEPIPAEEITNQLLPAGRPAWTAKPFQALFIDIEGMQIAIPMLAMGGIRQYPEQLTRIPNSAPWIDGFYQFHDQKIRIVNANRLLMSEKYESMEGGPQVETPEIIVQIGDGNWGLACRSADRALMLDPEQVRWSSAERSRRWILGMVKEPLCALLDVDEFIKYLDKSAAGV